MSNPPLSPRHYDKYTYSTRRRPERDSPPRERSPARSQFGAARRQPTEYEACIAGVAPLLKTPDGFAIAEDGTLMSRFCSPSRYGAPAVALVSIPVTVIARTAQGANGGDNGIPTSVTGTTAVFQNRTSPITATGLVPYTPRGFDTNAYSIEIDSWKKFCLAAGRDFSERELLDVTWDTLSQLLRHYGFVNAVENARIQLIWKRKNGGGAEGTASSSLVLPSDRSLLSPIAGDAFYVPAASLQSPLAISSPGAKFDRPLSPRRQGHEADRVIPDHKKPLPWGHVQAKIDSGLKRRAGSRSPARSGTSPAPNTPTRQL